MLLLRESCLKMQLECVILKEENTFAVEHKVVNKHCLTTSVKGKEGHTPTQVSDLADLEKNK